MTADAQQPGACADPSCPVLHADPANPIHPPDYEPGGPMWDWRPKASLTADNETAPAAAQTAGKDPSNKAEEGKQ